MQVASHGSLSRAYATPSSFSKIQSIDSTLSNDPPTSSTYSAQSAPSSRSSDTTQGTSHSTLFPPPMPPTPLLPASGAIEPTNNVMNKVAHKETSLFQICMLLRYRLSAVPGFDSFLHQQEEVDKNEDDAVSLLWNTFRQGRSLVALYDTLRPDQPINVDVSKYNAAKQGKALTSSFLRYCINELKFTVEDCFIINDLFGDDTTGFVKVTKMVSKLLDLMVQQGVITDARPDELSSSAANKRSQRQHIVHELVSTERTYVQHLEILQSFKQLCDSKGIISGDVSHRIFHNLDQLLNAQRRFLIRIEQINALPEAEQNWGKVFVTSQDAFAVYEPYIANQKLCEETVVKEFGKLKEAGGSVEMRQMVDSPQTLYGFLMKPFQRLTKYPLLLDQLYNKGDFDEVRKADLLRGKECAAGVLARTNTAIEREDKIEIFADLKNRVDNWRDHRVEQFGNLLLFGTFTVLKSEGPPFQEREYHVYLFESILLCCKDVEKHKTLNMMTARAPADRKAKPKLQLKGRIFTINITGVVKASKQGHYTCQIFWRGDPGIENFIIRFPTEEIMDKWYIAVLEQKKSQQALLKPNASSRQPATSATEFTYMQNQGALENPYRQEDDEDEDGILGMVAPPVPYPLYSTRSDFSNSRNASSTSLRSRSTTSESNPPQMSQTGRMPPPRLPPGAIKQPSLTLRTQQLSGYIPSPGEKFPESFFSPTMDSPMSSRTSASSGMYPFPRQAVPINGHYDEGHGRYTAPVMTRTVSRENNNAAYANSGNVRGVVPRPSFPAGSSMHSAQQIITSRNRSVSSPDVNNAQHRTMTGSRPPLPDVPIASHPAQYLQNGVPVARSQNNSPNPSNGKLPRGGTQSPKLQRDRSQTRTYQEPPQFGYDGSTHARADPRLAQVTASRSNTPTPTTRDVTTSPQLSSTASLTSSPDLPQGTQLKVKVHAPSAGQVLTLVVPMNISFQALRDRIDAKLQRSTNISLGDRTGNQVKLKYLDEDDLVSIQSDEDVQTAFETWREQRGEGFGGMGEIELFCQ